ncbi:tetratricopeptide repeat protein [Haliovirga abyssi]|uniref:Tetratricopeptide repeat protein n=1 Tax=Haliovirga abyssi TaxID=2996794 RepID=A0AAU9DR42_9FUSO|nr:tetratricopeptide repeat protein [Haliovirga abyssi]BDU51013.1 hypothetical protein HLVA_15820 [Haliovirga abyssi]
MFLKYIKKINLLKLVKKICRFVHIFQKNDSLIFLKKINKKSFFILFFILISVFSNGTENKNIYKNYNLAKNYYKNKEYKKSEFLLKKVLKKFPEYYKAMELLYEIEYINSEKKDRTEKFEDLKTNGDESIKSKLLYFFISQNDIKKSIEIYEKLDEKSVYKKDFLEFLFKNKKINLILNKYGNSEYIEKISILRKEADKLFFNSIEMLKSGKVENAILNLKKAIEIFPANYQYYYRLGLIFADNNNFKLAKINLKKALNLNKSQKIYLSLFRIYKDTNDINGIYNIAKYIIDNKEVQKELKKYYQKEKKYRKGIKILKKDDKYIYAENRFSDYLEIGDSFLIYNYQNILRDNITGEILYKKKNIVSKIRVYNITKKMLIFKIIYLNSEINLKNNYYIDKF